MMSSPTKCQNEEKERTSKSNQDDVAIPQKNFKTTEDTREIARSNSAFNHFRYVFIVFGGVVMGSMLFLRVNITVAMLSMVNKTALYLIEHPNSTADEFFPPDYVETGEFVWNNEIQQIIMTFYMLAYTIPQTFTTQLSMKYGVRPSVAISLCLCSLSNILTPTMAYWGWEWVLALRLINALGASAILPSMINVIEEFMPYTDTAQGVAIFQFVSCTLYTFTPLVSGFLTSINWKLAFLVPGTVGLVLSLLWYLIASDSPQTSKFVGQKELDLITGFSSDPTKQSEINKKTKKRTDLPWYFMFKIKSFYFLAAVWVLQCATLSGFLFLLPNYLNRVLSVPIEEVGLLNFTVQIGHMFSMLWPGPLSTFLEKKYGLGLTASRRIVVSISIFFVVGTYCYLGLYHENLVPVIAVNRFFHMTMDTLVLATVMSQFAKAGVSGLVYSMINAIGNSSLMLFCWIVGRFLDHTGETLESWSWILYSLSALMFLFFVIYCMFCHSKPVSIPTEKEKRLESASKTVC